MRVFLALLLASSLGAAEFEQVAGHEGMIQPEGAGILSKKVFSTEAQFYLDLDPESELAGLVPQFYGAAVRLEDLTEGFVHPNILDLKMGTRTWTEFSSKEKRAKCESSDCTSTTSSLGIRISGMRVNNAKFDRIKCKKFSGKELRTALDLYFGIQPGLAAEFKEKLKPIQQWFEKNREWRFTASSLLFVYEGANVEKPKAPVVKMIDFRYVHPTHGERDEGYLAGLSSLINELDRIEKLF